MAVDFGARHVLTQEEDDILMVAFYDHESRPAQYSLLQRAPTHRAG